MTGRPGDVGTVYTERTPRVVRARALLRRSRRDEARRFLAEGPQAVSEALAAEGRAGTAEAPAAEGRAGTAEAPAADAEELFGTEEALSRHAALVEAATAAGVRVSAVTDRALESLADTRNPQGLVAVCRYRDVDLTAVLARHPRLVVVLAGIADPGNAGTVLRTADAAGADAVVFTDDSVDVYNGKCVRSSAGSVFHLDVVRGGEPVAVAEALRAAGLWVVATDLRGAQDLDELTDAGAFAVPTGWLFGTEAHGLPAELSAAADARVRVPIHGRAESLNLAAAAAVCLYTSARAQRPRGAAERNRTDAEGR